MRIAVLTSSRADFGIYLPLLKKLKADQYFNVQIIAFGSHFSLYNGSTYKDIQKHGFKIDYQLNSILLTDDAESLTTSLGLTIIKFSTFWNTHKEKFDLVLILGDRYEMFAATVAGIPYQIRFAHIHGGETTLGAIDNVFRHSMTLASSLHFCSTENHALKIRQLTQQDSGVYNVGALSLDNLLSINLKEVQELSRELNINLEKKTILVTLHPETVAVSTNRKNARVLVKLLKQLKGYQIVITMPNIDTAGSVIRSEYEALASESDRIFTFENLGTVNYLSMLKHVSFLIGNTSSGIIEAASFGKFVVDLGERQRGREAGNNVYHLPFLEELILQRIHEIEASGFVYTGANVYYNGGASDKIINILKEEL